MLPTAVLFVGLTPLLSIWAALEWFGLASVLRRRSGLRGEGWYCGDNHDHMIHGERTVQVDFPYVALAARAARLDPQRTTTAYIKEDRHGRVFLDSTRSGGGTIVAAYSPRVRDRA